MNEIDAVFTDPTALKLGSAEFAGAKGRGVICQRPNGLENASEDVFRELPQFLFGGLFPLNPIRGHRLS
ncbi:MAG: hypothetical protein ACT4P5_19740, partial [Armatimonadota bacterium]